MTRRIDAAPLLALLGAVLLLVSLLLAWYEPSTEAWDAFEITDLLLAAVGVAALLAALALVADVPAWVQPRWLPWLALIALVLVLNALISPPPVIDADPETGLWLALAGAALMGAGAVLTLADVAVTFDVSARERRRRAPGEDPTEPLPPTRADGV